MHPSGSSWLARWYATGAPRSARKGNGGAFREWAVFTPSVNLRPTPAFNSADFRRRPRACILRGCLRNPNGNGGLCVFTRHTEDAEETREETTHRHTVWPDSWCAPARDGLWRVRAQPHDTDP